MISGRVTEQEYVSAHRLHRRRMVENDDVILLYVNDVWYEIVARRCFHDAADMQDFRRHLRFVN